MHWTRKQARSAGRTFIVNHYHIIHQTKRYEWAGINTASTTYALIFVDFQQWHGFSLKNLFRDNFIGQYSRRLLDTIGLNQVQNTLAFGLAENLYHLCRTAFQT